MTTQRRQLFDELYEVRLGFVPDEYWGGGEDGDGGDLTGAAPLRSAARSFIADHSGHESGANLREMAIEFTTPEDLCAAMEQIERWGLSEEDLDRLLNDEEGEVPARASAPTTSNGLEVRVNGQLLADFLAGKPNTARIVPLSLRGRRPQGGKRRRRRGRRGHGNGHSGNGRR